MRKRPPVIVLLLAPLVAACGGGSVTPAVRLARAAFAAGGAPSAPTLSAPAPFEKSPTTTPTFTFSSTDPGGSTLNYTLEWDTDPAFSAPSTQAINGQASGAQVGYTLTAGQALTTGTTYYWRVEATNTSAVTSPWSATRSFTIDTSIAMARWFVTSQWQWQQGTFSDTDATYAGSVTVDFSTTPYWTDDFEGGTTGGFSIYRSCSGCTLSNSTVTAHGGTHSLQMVDNDTASSNGWEIANIDGNLTGSQTRLVYWEDRADAGGGEPFAGPCFCQTGSCTTLDPVSRVIQWGWSTPVQQYYSLYSSTSKTSNATPFSPTVPYTPGTWNKVTIDYDSGAQTSDISINGVPRQANIPFEYTGTPTGVILSTSYNADTTETPTMYYDDFAAYAAVTSGTYDSPPVLFSNAPTGAVGWGRLLFTDTIVATGDQVILQVQYYNGTAWALVPDTALAGNSTGFTTGPVDLSGLSTTTYAELRVLASLSRPSTSSPGPTLDDVTVSFLGGPAAVAFTTASQTVTAGACSGATTVEIRDLNGYPSPEASATQVALSSTSGTMKFYSDASCTTQVSSANVAAGGTQGTFYFVDTAVGTPTITAQVTGLSRATQGETVDPGPASTLAFTTGPQSVAAGGCSGIATVESQDAYGNTVTVASATQLALSSGSGTMTFYSNATCTTPVSSATIAAGGSTASFYFSDTTAGSPGITAAATGFTSGAQTETITAGAATALAFTTAAQTVAAGACSGIATVEARDGYGNPTTVASATTVSLSPSSGTMTFYSNATCTTVVSTATIPAAGSTASFYFSDTAAGGPTVTAAASGLGQTTQAETLVAAAPSKLVFTTASQTVTAGACSSAVKAQTRDAYGNIATVAGATQVNLSATSGTMRFYSDATCTTLVGFVSIPAAASTATFYFVDPTAGTPSVTASAAGLTSANQGETIDAGSASTLAFVTAAQTVTAGACSGIVTVESQDGYGNGSPVASATPVSLSSSSGTMTLYSDSLCTTPVTSVTIAASAAKGNFYFSDKTAGSPKITASAASLSTTNQTETISPAAPASLVFATAARTVTAGACSGIVTVGTKDAYGNAAPVASATTVSLSSTATQMTFYSDPGCTTAVTTTTIAPSSTVTSFYFADTAAGTPTITVTSSGLTGASQVETVDPGSASKLAFTTPARTVAAGACSPVLTVQTQDGYGNPSPVSTATAVSLSSTTTVTFYSDATCTTVVSSVAIAVAGRSASFYLEDTAAESPTVTASATGLSAASQVETITAGAPAALAFTTAAQTVAAGACSGVATVESRDAYGNVATVTAATAVSLTGGPGALTFYSDAACTTQVTTVAIAASGSTASFYFEGQAAGPAGATAASTGLTSATQTETIVAGAADHVAVTGPTSATSGATVTLTLQTEDAFGNPVAGAQPVTAAVTGSATATLPATTLAGATPGGQSVSGTTGANGSATVDVTDTATGTVQVCTSDASLSTQSCHSVTFGAGAPDHVVLTPAAATAAAGTKVTVVVQVVDASGNPTPTPTVVDVGLATTGSAVLLPGGTAAISVTTDTSGAATFQVQDTTAEAVTLSVTSAAASGTALPETKPDGTAQVTFTAGPADHVILTGPATTTAGTATTVTVQAVDAYGNPTTGALSVCVAAAGSASGAPTVAPGTLGSPAQPSPNDACGTTAAATGTATVSFTDTTAEDVTLTGTVSGTSTTLTVTVGPAGPDHLLVTPPASATDACGTATVTLQVVDAYGNPVTNPSVDQVQVTVSVTAGTGTAQILSTSLSGAGSLPAAQVTGTTGTGGSATVGVTLDAATTASVAWTSTALPTAQASPATVAFQVGALDPATSTVVSDVSQVAAGTGSATITVTPMDGCGLALGTGHTVTVAATYGTLGAVTDVGDGTYTSTFTTNTCQTAPATVSATVDGTTLSATADVATVCKQVDPTTPVTPATGTADACARGGTYVDLTVTPVDSTGAPLPPGQSVTVDADPPRIVPGTVTSTTDSSTGATTYTLPVGSNRCSATPRAVTVRVNGTALQTTPMLTFGCLPVDASKTAFAAAPATAPADGKTEAKVLVTAMDTCGNRAFGRSVTAQATNGALKVTVTPASGTTVDDAGKADDGTVTLALVSDLAGRTGLSATVDGVTAGSAPNLVHFTLGDVLKVAYAADVARGVAGQTVTLTATLTSRYAGTLADLTLSRHDTGLALVSVAGAKTGKNGTLLVASLGAKKTATVRLVERLGVGTSVAASHLSVDYHAATDDGHRQAVSPTVSIPIGGQVGPGGCECGSTGGSPAAALPFALLLASLLLLRRRHADR